MILKPNRLNDLIGVEGDITPWNWDSTFSNPGVWVYGRKSGGATCVVATEHILLQGKSVLRTNTQPPQ
jgi:hypothetical protein